MLKIYIISAIRFFKKDRIFSILNILGLALGIAISMVLVAVLKTEFSYDQFHTKHNRIYRLGGHIVKKTGVEVNTAQTASELGVVVSEEITGVENFARVEFRRRLIVKNGLSGSDERSFYESRILRTDSSFFNLFTHKFRSGSPTSALKQPFSVVLTESAAKKYFGDKDPMLSTLIVDNIAFKITGVIEDVPVNSHLMFDFVTSTIDLSDREWMKEDGKIKSEAFWNTNVYTYLLMNENYHPEGDFETKFQSINDKYIKPFGTEIGSTYSPILEPLTSIHFYSKLSDDLPRGNINYLYAFAAIGAMIILLACINYMNLATAKAVTRANEISLKRVLGSGKTPLVVSLIVESMMLTFISLIIALLLTLIVFNTLPTDQFFGKEVELDILDPVFIGSILGITLFIGLLSGLYPAFYISNLPNTFVSTGRSKGAGTGETFRKVLTTMQFSISIIVVVCAVLMREQIDFVRRHELGFDKANIIVMPIPDSTVRSHVQALKTELLRSPLIASATTSYNILGFVNPLDDFVMKAEGNEGMRQQNFTLILVGEDYVKTMGMTIVQGRDLNTGPNSYMADEFLANEAAAKLMGWGENAVGKKVKFFHAEKDAEVVGIVKDFNFSSLHNEIGPVLIWKFNDGGNMNVRVNGNLSEAIKVIREKWEEINPGYVFDYSFIDSRFDEAYKVDDVLFRLLTVLSGICVSISLLGLLGLTGFLAVRRTKEIGIRKLLGASVPSIIMLLYRNVLFVLIAAMIIGFPLSYYTFAQWLSNFAYQMPGEYNILIWVATASVFATLLIVGAFSYRTANVNPARVLKAE